MGFWKKVGQYWAFILSIILIGIITYYSVFYPNISKWWFIGIIAISTIASFIDKIKNDGDFESVIDNLKINLNKNGASIVERNKILDKQIKITKEWNEKKEVSLNLLNRLINKGLIDREEINKPFDNSEIFALYCFPTTHQIKRDNQVVHHIGNRIYPEFLQSLGFIRLHGIGLFYVISKERLAKELQSTFELKRYILDKVNEIIKREWAEYLDSIKNNRSKYVRSKYQQISSLDYKDVLKFNILLMNTDISENNIGYLNNKRAFSNEFNNYLKQQVDLNKINIEKSVKGKIINFVNSISFELFFFEEKKADLDKLKKEEQQIKNNLKIDKWADYLNKNDSDIAIEISKAGFLQIKSLEYARLLKQRVKEYTEALRELRISY